MPIVCGSKSAAIRSFKADLGKIVRTGIDTQPRDLEPHRASASIMAQLESVFSSWAWSAWRTGQAPWRTKTATILLATCLHYFCILA